MDALNFLNQTSSGLVQTPKKVKTWTIGKTKSPREARKGQSDLESIDAHGLETSSMLLMQGEQVVLPRLICVGTRSLMLTFLAVCTWAVTQLLYPINMTA